MGHSVYVNKIISLLNLFLCDAFYRHPKAVYQFKGHTISHINHNDNFMCLIFIFFVLSLPMCSFADVQVCQYVSLLCQSVCLFCQSVCLFCQSVCPLCQAPLSITLLLWTVCPCCLTHNYECRAEDFSFSPIL